MNSYIMLRRLRWPAVLVLIGVLALFDEMGLIHFWHMFIPLLLILLGVLMLAERAVLATEGVYPPYPGAIPGTPYPGAGPYPPAGGPLTGAAPQQAEPGTSIVPAPQHDLDIHRGGES